MLGMALHPPDLRQRAARPQHPGRHGMTPPLRPRPREIPAHEQRTSRDPPDPRGSHGPFAHRSRADARLPCAAPRPRSAPVGVAAPSGHRELPNDRRPSPSTSPLKPIDPGRTLSMRHARRSNALITPHPPPFSPAGGGRSRRAELHRRAETRQSRRRSECEGDEICGPRQTRHHRVGVGDVRPMLVRPSRSEVTSDR